MELKTVLSCDACCTLKYMLGLLAQARSSVALSA
jgi:hypothetical protein